MIPAVRSLVSHWDIPVSRTAENGASAGTDTVTGRARRADSRCSSHDPLAGSSTGRPSQVARTGTCPGGDRPASRGTGLPDLG